MVLSEARGVRLSPLKELAEVAVDEVELGDEVAVEAEVEDEGELWLVRVAAVADKDLMDVGRTGDVSVVKAEAFVLLGRV
jgi:hypothetical protein